MVYETYNAILKQNADLSAAEAHGIATGLLCVNAQLNAAQWLAELSSNSHALDESSKTQLNALFTQTSTSLASNDFEFELFLPNEDTPLTERVTALKDWCQGFLYALGALNAAIKWSADSKEIVRDLSEMTKLDTNAEGEDDENDFIEITEYCKAAVLMLCAELAVHYH
jgi:yecA family protein